MKDDNPFLPFFPAFRRLRRHGVRLGRHHIAAAACVPSRASLYTGQYPSRHLATQTSGMFKQAYDPGFPWLPNNQVPTAGDWFRAAGYSTHYFGRHDFSNPPAPSLEEWGFSDWALSWPSSQGGGPSNLGVFRDIGYSDVANGFFNRKALGVETNIRNIYDSTNATKEQTPWFAVAAFVNPHDITGWPLPWLGGVQTGASGDGDNDPEGIFAQIGALLAAPAPIPSQGERSRAPAGGSYRVPLNPDGFPQDNSLLAPSWNSDLSTKPTCQYEASFKIGQGFLALYPQQLWQVAPLPYKSAARPQEWLLAHLQAYIYFQYLVNLEIDKLLANLEEIGLLDDTVIVFTSDHGEMGGAHGGQIEKWHNAYRETVHVPFVVSSPLVNPSADTMVDIDQVTSHIDLLPTLLGLAGYSKSDQAALEPLILGHEVYPLPGRDLSGLISGDGSGKADDREGVLFVTQDNITLPTDNSSLPATFTNFLKIVDEAIAQGKQNTTSGPITQPNHVYAYCEKRWKLVRYIDGRRSDGGSTDPAAYEPDQWELYDLAQDPAETINLVSWQHGEPVPETNRIPLGWQLDEMELVAILEVLRVKLAAEMARVGYGPDGGPAKQPQQGELDLFSTHDFNIP